MPFAATWMDLESIILSEVSQTGSRDIIWHPLFVESKRNDTNKLTNKTETDSQTLRKSLWLGGRYGIPYLWNLKGNDTNKLTNKTETDSQTLRKSLWLPGGKMVRRDS